VPLSDNAATERLVLASFNLATLGQPTSVPLSPFRAGTGGWLRCGRWGGWQWPPVFASRERCAVGQTIHRQGRSASALQAPGHRGGTGVTCRRRAAVRRAGDQCDPDRSGGLCGVLASSLWAVTSYRLMIAITTGRVLAQVRQVDKKRRAARGRRAASRPDLGWWGGWRSAGGVASSAAANAISLSESRVRVRRTSGRGRGPPLLGR
jgi:hypothetical protein